MDTFIKQVSGVYTLVHNYEYQMFAGEAIYAFNIYIDDIHPVEAAASGLYSSGMVTDYATYDATSLLFTVANGTHESGYYIKTEITTNAGNTYDKTTYMTIDETDYPEVYGEFHYRFQTSLYDRNIYIVPKHGDAFQYNQEYHVNILAGLSGVYNSTMQEADKFWFTSQYCPLFATLTTIELMGGPTIENFADDTVYRMIHKNSIDIIDIFNLGNQTNYPYYYWGCTPENVPALMRRYVECKTTYDLLNIAESYTGVSNTVGQTKHLGDLDIKYNGTPGSTGSTDLTAPDIKKKLYDCFNSIVDYFSRGVTIAVKGLYDCSKGYPHPVLDPGHNRVIKGIDPYLESSPGPGFYGTGWRYVDKGGAHIVNRHRHYGNRGRF